MNRFFDFGELNPDYMDMGKPSRNDTIIRMIAKVTAATLKVNSKYIQMRQMIYMEHLDDNFYHGTFQTNGHIVSFFYFKDISIGCLSAVAVGKGFPTYIKKSDQVHTQSLTINL